MRYMLYFIITVTATSAGAFTGMGGGVIIKPLLDILGDYNAENIGVLSSVTVFAMAIVSVLRQSSAGEKVDKRSAIALATGSTAGGLAGERLLMMLINEVNANSAVIAIQNIFLGAIIVVIFFYMLHRDRIKDLCLTGSSAYVLAGLLLGLISSFLSIGGGPLNVALLMFVFSIDIKTSAVYSLVTILFAQLSKLVLVCLSSGFGRYDLSMLIVMIPGAIIGGLIGSLLSKRSSLKNVVSAYNTVQIAVFAFCVLNIIRNI